MKKKIFFMVVLLATLLCFCSCGEITTYDFYVACLSGNEEVVSKFLEGENIVLELDEQSSEKLIKKVQSVDKNLIFKGDESIFIDNPVAVSILGNNESVTNLLCQKLPLDYIEEDYSLCVAVKTNNTNMGRILYDNRIFPTTYLPYIVMIENDNAELFKLFSIVIDDITVPPFKNNDNFLMYAAKNNAEKCVEYLVSTKLFDLNAINSQYKTALGYAYDVNANQNIIDLLIKENGEYIRKSIIQQLLEIDALTEKCVKYCDKSVYSYDVVMDLVYEVGSSEFTAKINNFWQQNKSISEFEAGYITDSFYNFYEAFSKMENSRRWG